MGYGPHVQTDQGALIVSVAAGCVALYGAVNSRRALAWQRRRDEELRSVKLEILCEHRLDTVAQELDARPREENRGYRLIVSIVNASEQAVVYVSEVLMRSPTQDGGTFLQTQEPDVCLQPRERMSRMLWIDKHETQFFPDLRFVIDVTLASGVTFTSGEGLLDAESVEEAEAAKRLRGGEMLPEDWPVVSSIIRMPPDYLFSESGCG
jgi:hypothetical protein